jgi:hypothetical protein
MLSNVWQHVSSSRSVTNSTLALSKSIPKPCYIQYTGIFKIDTEMTCYRQYTGGMAVLDDIGLRGRCATIES